ncbi:glutathione binding-like protein, partial [Pseudomonas aeruginosa]
AGEQYSIADIATFGWTHTARIVDFDFSHYRHLDDWHRRMALRPAVQRGILLPEPAVGP